MSTPPATSRPTVGGITREVAEVWTLRKGTRVASCHFWTHPKGGEARLTVDGEWNRGSVAVEGRTLLDVALDWREQFQATGWE